MFSTTTARTVRGVPGLGGRVLPSEYQCLDVATGAMMALRVGPVDEFDGWMWELNSRTRHLYAGARGAYRPRRRHVAARRPNPEARQPRGVVRGPESQSPARLRGLAIGDRPQAEHRADGVRHKHPGYGRFDGAPVQRRHPGDGARTPSASDRFAQRRRRRVHRDAVVGNGIGRCDCDRAGGRSRILFP